MLFFLRKLSGSRSRYKFANMVARLLYTRMGQAFISALFGLAIAFMFQRVCKDRKCIIIRAPPMSEVKDKVFDTGNGCYTYQPIIVPCEEDEAPLR